ncbi:asparagine synthase (glutamine-hydrolyzing) [Synechococcus sp. Minos11]|uniref:asparagine synthase (glutamine-hydrolyzing) n=1 Tax=Synechococcus sp. Minos11 TaxID=221341 RepID=UPI001649497E|nr:asparagine synthase (glutamine-hydrolyzing) [Synechococcus sp. Minos11]QNJ07704.1 asparagine synthase (glutamine-hydrolyzing) [Synechococcus sp. Minos11]
MCGFIASFSSLNPHFSSFRASLDRLATRGPDAEGFWQEPGVFLGHRRLSILDLSQRANQPMVSRTNRFIIVFNGEIYNYRSLRSDLVKLGHKFRTDTDTEVLIELYSRYKSSMLNSLEGMFSFVIWDTFEQYAFAARDPYGIKPLYLGTSSHSCILCSQVKPIILSGLVDASRDPIAHASFLLFGSIFEPHTTYRQVQSIPAGHYIYIRNSIPESPIPFFDFPSIWSSPNPASSLSKSQVQLHTSALLKDSIHRHLVSDVPVGLFLSAGLDSATLAGLCREATQDPLHAITIKFKSQSTSHFDETEGASLVSRIYSLDHYIREIHQSEFLTDLPLIIDSMDQPSIDGVNTWYASKAASEIGLKVALSGIGGDELFWGYSTFSTVPALLSLYNLLSSVDPSNSIVSSLFNLISVLTGNPRWAYAPNWLNHGIAGSWCLARSISVPNRLPCDLVEQLLDYPYALSSSFWPLFDTPDIPLNSKYAVAYLESSRYLRNQLLRDTDWSSMHHSVEVRTPLVDSTLLCNLSPFFDMFSQFPRKCLLTDSLKKPLPRSILSRKKTGFGIPINKWMKESNSGFCTWPSFVSSHFFS